MTTLLAIDPGRDSGWARFEGPRLIAAGLWDGQGSPEIYGDELVIERPQIYPGPRQRGDQNDLISLAILVGMFAQMAYDSCMSVRFVRPCEWKGNLPKPKRAADPYIVETRVVAALDSSELVVFQDALKSIAGPRGGVPAKQRMDIVDAVGIGLFAHGRFAR